MRNLQFNTLIYDQYAAPTMNTGRGGNIFFGTGLVTPKQITTDIPFDFYGYLLTAEAMRRQLGAEKIIHLLADSYSLKSKPVQDAPLIMEKIEQALVRYREIAARLGMDSTYRLVRASELDGDPGFMAIRDGIDLSAHGVPEMAVYYVTQQLAVTAYMARHCEVYTKLSWLADPKAKKIGFDERYFDNLYDKVFPGDGLSYAYTSSGRSLNPERARVSPYILTETPAQRLSVSYQPEAFAAFAEAIDATRLSSSARAMRAHLNGIVSLYETLYAPLSAHGLADKIRGLMEQGRPIRLAAPMPVPILL